VLAPSSRFTAFWLKRASGGCRNLRAAYITTFDIPVQELPLPETIEVRAGNRRHQKG